MAFSTIFFDLDDTLYPASLGLWEAIRVRMHTYMQRLLGLPDEELAAMRQHYLETYGTTLRGLQMNHQVDTEDFLAYVHDLPLNSYLKPDPALRALLLSLPQQRWIFTNSDANHTRRVMNVLGVGDCFAGIIDIHAIQFESKPNQAAYQHALRIAGEAEACNCVYLDDSARNLLPARQMGFYTVLVGGQPDPQAACMHLASLHDLPDCMPDLWKYKPNGRYS
jgi:putative hydrolase of the HAD superfamily